MNIETAVQGFSSNLSSSGVQVRSPAAQRETSRTTAQPISTNTLATESQNASDSNVETRAKTNQAVEQLNSFAKSIRPELSFSVDEASGTQVVRLVDIDSKEVIRQIPSEEAIQIAQALDKFQGLFIKDKA